MKKSKYNKIKIRNNICVISGIGFPVCLLSGYIADNTICRTISFIGLLVCVFCLIACSMFNPKIPTVKDIANMLYIGMSETELIQLLSIWNGENMSKSVLIDGTVIYVKTWQNGNIHGTASPLGLPFFGASVEMSKTTTVWCKNGLVIGFKNENI